MAWFKSTILQFVFYLSCGRGKDDAWIITFPENCNFKCIPEEVIAKVLTYLTSIARQNGSDSRFTIILDRRLDTWSSLKTSLQKISSSFPGNLHLVLVLRPTSFLQRTFTDIGFRFSQEDFMLKLPVVMLSSVSDLLTYIDDKQLTTELGGTLRYCHSEWITFRNAIENFALTVKDTAQMLQSFGTELADTELPGDIPAIEEILAIRAERYHLLKKDITAVTKEGKILLTNLEVPDAEGAVSSRLENHQQTSGDWQTINKLLTQVHDMEIAFDGFWEKHQLKMEQYLQLWKFEQDFQELVSEAELILNQQAELADVTGTIAQVKQKIKKLENLDENSQDLLAKARFVIIHGHRLAASHHYALDLICQRCNELRYLSDILVNEIRTKRIQLSRTFKMHKLLQQLCPKGRHSVVSSDRAAKAASILIEMVLSFIIPFLLPSIFPDIRSIHVSSFLGSSFFPAFPHFCLGIYTWSFFKKELFPSPGDLPDPGIEPWSTTLQADSLPSEPSLKPLHFITYLELCFHMRNIVTVKYRWNLKIEDMMRSRRDVYLTVHANAEVPSSIRPCFLPQLEELHRSVEYALNDKMSHFIWKESCVSKTAHQYQLFKSFLPFSFVSKVTGYHLSDILLSYNRHSVLYKFKRNPTDRRQVGYSLWSHKELNTTKQLILSLSLLTYNSMLVPVTQHSDLIFLYISKCQTRKNIPFMGQNSMAVILEITNVGRSELAGSCVISQIRRLAWLKKLASINKIQDLKRGNSCKKREALLSAHHPSAWHVSSLPESIPKVPEEISQRPEVDSLQILWTPLTMGQINAQFLSGQQTRW
ncbi:hypothetical protein FD755_016363 [Muntiacus reevesi]|uniref:CRAL-TRIO domain-containing protein n=1 Tax=Muntiacus reevesi TaxID=9886 RepID=A0A5N3XF42_MUNRE|nr:hypothetical protein FD755_016363 [Muntiacus reevesi]